MKRFLGFTLILAALAVAAFTANPAEAATIGGAVLDARGNPVPGALVTLQQQDVPRGQRPYAARLQADRRGVFIFEGIPGGRYVIAAQHRIGAVRQQVGVREDGAIRVRLILPGRRPAVDRAPLE